jgi:hypothetical protein
MPGLPNFGLLWQKTTGHDLLVHLAQGKAKGKAAENGKAKASAPAQHKPEAAAPNTRSGSERAALRAMHAAVLLGGGGCWCGG